MKLTVTVNGQEYDVEVEVQAEHRPSIDQILVRSTSAYGVTPSAAKAPAGSSNALTATIAGTVVAVKVEDGQQVAEGDTVLVLEAMKMETEVTAPKAGVVAHVAVTVGDAVQGGQVLVEWAE